MNLSKNVFFLTIFSYFICVSDFLFIFLSHKEITICFEDFHHEKIGYILHRHYYQPMRFGTAGGFQV